ncbi:MAG: SMI1/KNR4 family protein [Planctomycetota bacterium]|nr:MAG: SMI1/KNR4 family protein [Planctomycetota bacterium]
MESSGSPLPGRVLSNALRLLVPMVSEIPADYTKFLKKHNGGTPQVRGFSFHHPRRGAQEYWVDEFLGIEDESLISGTSQGMLTTLVQYREFIPVEFIPIGIAVRDDLLLLCIEERSRCYGEVWLLEWDSVVRRVDQIGPPDNSLHFVAESFASFLASLHETG